MFIVLVTPLIRDTKLESLSYFSTKEYEIGSFLMVPIRGKSHTAIVTETRLASSSKTALKAATFSLRKLPNQTDLVILPDTFRQAAELLTKKYSTTTGAIIFSLLPPDIRNGSHPYPRTMSTKHQQETTPQLLTACTDERYLAYKSLIRNTFARRGSVILVVPTSTEISHAVDKLSHGIKDRVVTFSAQQTKRQRTKSYEKISDTTNSKLIITTPSHAYLERADLLVIIVEQSASGYYVTRRRPFLDHRVGLIALAKTSGREIVLGDTVPRTEDEVNRREENYLTYGEESKRIAFPAPLSIIKLNDKPKPEVPFQLFSKELLIGAERALEARGHVFFYAARRGLAPVVACVDCGYIFRCPDSNTPFSLMRTTNNGEEQRWFVSSTSGRRVRASDICSQCGSWRLRERGIGIQQVYDEWMKASPDSDVVVIDNATVTTAKQANKIAEDFFNKRSGVMIGTQMALPFLSHGVDVSAIISLDATRAIPTWRADESLFRLLLRLRECTHKEVIVQTRTETDNLLIHATRGAIERFYDEEIALRKMLQYPPYSTFILLTWVGTASSVIELEKPITSNLSGFDVQIYNNPNSNQEKTQRHALLRIDRKDTLIYQTLLTKLCELPPYIKVEVNPERIV